MSGGYRAWKPELDCKLPLGAVFRVHWFLGTTHVILNSPQNTKVLFISGTEAKHRKPR